MVSPSCYMGFFCVLNSHIFLLSQGRCTMGELGVFGAIDAVWVLLELESLSDRCPSPSCLTITAIKQWLLEMKRAYRLRRRGKELFQRCLSTEQVSKSGRGQNE